MSDFPGNALIEVVRSELNSSYLNTNDLKHDLKSRSIKGGFITVLAQVIKFSFRAISGIVLGRLLAPEDYGLVGMVSAIINMALLFSDMGLSTATIQKKDITQPQVSNLFWINMGISILIMFLHFCSAPLIAAFYHEPRLFWIVVLLSINYPINSLSTQHLALLSRKMQYLSLVIIDLTAMIGGTLVGIIMALLNFKYWSLIAISVATVLINFTMCWTLCHWRPSWPRRDVGTKSLFKFGMHLTGSSITNYLARNMDNILIGWRSGSVSLGYYSKAYQLFLMPLQQINGPLSAVVLPGLSRLQDEPEKFRNYYKKALAILTSLAMPISMGLAVLSDDIILLLLGPKWMPAVPLLKVLSIAAVFQPVMNTSGWLYIATGRSKAMLQWTVFSSITFIISFIIGLPYGAMGVAKCYMVARLLLFFPSVYFASRETPVSCNDTLKAMLVPFMSSLMVGLVCWLLKIFMSGAMGIWNSSIILLLCSLFTSVFVVVLANIKLYMSIGLHKRLLERIPL